MKPSHLRPPSPIAVGDNFTKLGLHELRCLYCQPQPLNLLTSALTALHASRLEHLPRTIHWHFLKWRPDPGG